MGNTTSEIQTQNVEAQPLISTEEQLSVDNPSIQSDQSVDTVENTVNDTVNDTVENTVNDTVQSIINKKYVHPVIDLINSNQSENEIIEVLKSFVGTNVVGTNENGQTIYDCVDQVELFGPAMQVFCHCACYGKKDVTDWILKNYVPLQVSYGDNFTFFETQKYKHFDISDMLVKHESFVPSYEVMQNLLSRSKYDLLEHCLNNPNLEKSHIDHYNLFIQYLSNKQYSNINELLVSLKKDSNTPIVSGNESETQPLQVTEIVNVNDNVTLDEISYSEIVTDTLPQNVESGIQLESTTEVKPESTTEVKPESTSEVQPESTTEFQPESTTVVEPESTTKVEPESTTEFQPESTTEVEPESTTEPQVESTTEFQPESSTEPQVESTVEVQAESMNESSYFQYNKPTYDI
ncbi:hypothetical protein [Acanthamoeba castellanii mimivirus]|jgi:hypothetical protein|uniref:Uncharacterized protein R554 n=5 Tax=Mimivirus TaxID=315393 RepID=YR554_MIMIV|nr:hypothetical protein MIMI_gp0596 [Acanthamoeba polyphaga mimivirus]Q5UR34.1 RecName: Full=Uncharacterized protein R554 [Acanthamoeba polyphaga mimivirus]AHA45296.1 hypothetical protein HIRU_S390 [Hirudovirus strain Sangsue]ALR84143.1 hypothetical protein [Niemeyer virus]AMK61940.1 hypothetical protein [Samba virus]AMZ02998.1 hypothetical protein [Mimivirus Bombay]BAV61667.1 hypothetical protein [Acanthamoeba castellanii mimivirus]